MEEELSFDEEKIKWRRSNLGRDVACDVALPYKREGRVMF